MQDHNIDTIPFREARSQSLNFDSDYYITFFNMKPYGLFLLW